MNKRIYVFLIVLSFILSSCITLVQSPNKVDTKLTSERDNLLLELRNKFLVRCGDDLCDIDENESACIDCNLHRNCIRKIYCLSGKNMFCSDDSACENKITKIKSFDYYPKLKEIYKGELNQEFFQKKLQLLESYAESIWEKKSTKEQCGELWKHVYKIRSEGIKIDEEDMQLYLKAIEECYGKDRIKELPAPTPKIYNHKINVIEPKTSYDCTHLDEKSASDETIARCNLYNYCDNIVAYDITVRKSATEAISQHSGSYSTNQLIDIYNWVKLNIFYQNVPLDDFAPYRPSETIALKSGDCKNYAAVISSMILSIGGSARIVVVPKCIHAFAEVYIGHDNSLIENLAQEIKQRYQQNIEINVIKDSEGYWLILDGAGSNYAGTTEIKECLDSNAERYYSYTCVSADGKINKQTYKKEYLSKAVTFLCDNCKSVNDCKPECEYVCIKAGWAGDNAASSIEVPKLFGLKTDISCTCTCYK